MTEDEIRKEAEKGSTMCHNVAHNPEKYKCGYLYLGDGLGVVNDCPFCPMKCSDVTVDIWYEYIKDINDTLGEIESVVGSVIDD